MFVENFLHLTNTQVFVFHYFITPYAISLLQMFVVTVVSN